ncbi:MAG: hypothetical protein ACYSWQ_25570, partial [Planctomycetota bacterium]
IMMSRLRSRACLTVAISFIVGFLCSPVVIGLWKGQFVAPVELQRRTEAHSFFYRTMIELFDGTYNPEEGFVRQDALDTYDEYADRFGGMCLAHLYEDSGGGFNGDAFFPSGDVCEVAIRKLEGHWHLTYFRPRNWSLLWTDTLDRYDVPDSVAATERMQ